MKKNKAALHRGNDNSAKASIASDAHILAYDVLLAVSGVVLIVGIPFIMAVLKQWGCW